MVQESGNNLQYSKRELNRAGERLIGRDMECMSMNQALAIINDWRTRHSFPLNTFQKRLRSQATSINKDVLVVQRLKRMESIFHKLKNNDKMNMAQMQDIGGCRAIMKNIDEVDELTTKYLHKSRGIKHALFRHDDYIYNPKPSGYRGVHLIYRYRSDKNTDFDDLKIEIQIRSELQHAWATTVETVGIFNNQMLKSSIGDEDWLHFFKLMSSAFAIEEGKPVIENQHEDKKWLYQNIQHFARILDVEKNLSGFRTAIHFISDVKGNEAQYYLIKLNLNTRSLQIKPYMTNQIDVASIDYLTYEKRAQEENMNVVLISAQSVDNIKLAYPNYYGDTDRFLYQLSKIIQHDQLQLPF